MNGGAERACRRCGCRQDAACFDAGGACWWVEADLCSHCAEPDPAKRPPPRGFEHRGEPLDVDCGLGPDGLCYQAGTAWCDFNCPYRDGER